VIFDFDFKSLHKWSFPTLHFLYLRSSWTLSTNRCLGEGLWCPEYKGRCSKSCTHTMMFFFFGGGSGAGRSEHPSIRLHAPKSGNKIGVIFWSNGSWVLTRNSKPTSYRSNYSNHYTPPFCVGLFLATPATGIISRLLIATTTAAPVTVKHCLWIANYMWTGS